MYMMSTQQFTYMEPEHEYTLLFCVWDVTLRYQQVPRLLAILRRFTAALYTLTRFHMYLLFSCCTFLFTILYITAVFTVYIHIQEGFYTELHESYYAALLPRRGRILRRTLSVRLSVRPVIVAIGNVFSSTASVTDVLFGTHWRPHIVRPSRPHRFLFYLWSNRTQSTRKTRSIYKRRKKRK